MDFPVSYNTLTDGWMEGEGRKGREEWVDGKKGGMDWWIYEGREK